MNTIIHFCCMLMHVVHRGEATRLSSLLSGPHSAPVLQAAQLLGDLPHRQAKLGAMPAQAMLFEDEAPAHVKELKKFVKNFWRLKPGRSKTRFLASDWIQFCSNSFLEAKRIQVQASCITSVFRQPWRSSWWCRRLPGGFCKCLLLHSYPGPFDKNVKECD